jgi:hypothetical protein
MDTTVLFDKNGIQFSKVTLNNYNATFSIENKTLNLPSIITFDFIKSIYDLSPDIFEHVNLVKINDNEAIVTLLIKHLFQEIGIPQKFIHVHMLKVQSANTGTISFVASTLQSQTDRPEHIPASAELMVLNKMVTVCDIITRHKIKVSTDIVLDDGRTIQPYVEKFMGTILSKIFKRVKQFIENMRIT